MTPSLNIAFNKDLEKDQEKLETALDVLDCMISEEGQRRIANGRCVISLNTDVPTMMQDISGLEDEMKSNSIYIRYSAQKSFSPVRRLFLVCYQARWMKPRHMMLSAVQ